VAALLIGILVAAGLLSAGCTAGQGAGDSTPADIVLNVVATEWKFEPADVQVQAGKAVRVSLENKGAVAHNFAVKDLAFVVDAAPNQTRTKNFTASKSGTYRVICSLPGHAEAGMVGTLTVTEGGVRLVPAPASSLASQPSIMAAARALP
jgi:uncharacterized cupredoxin-like copper-binding protein